MKLGKAKQNIESADTCTKDILYIPMSKLSDIVVVYRGKQASGKSKWRK